MFLCTVIKKDKKAEQKNLMWIIDQKVPHVEMDSLPIPGKKKQTINLKTKEMLDYTFNPLHSHNSLPQSAGFSNVTAPSLCNNAGLNRR